MLFNVMGEIPNRLVAALDPYDFEYLQARFREVELSSRHVLCEPRQPVDTVYFPVSAVIAQLVLNGAGAPVAAFTTAFDGLAGLCACLGGAPSLTRQVVLSPGRALSLDRSSLLEAAERSPSLRGCFAAYIDAFTADVLQSAACLAGHSLEERLARYLLAYTDDDRSAELPIVEEFLASVLGVRQSRLMLAARTLQTLGLIQYRPDFFRVVNRVGLEDVACECYGAIRARYRQSVARF